MNNEIQEIRYQVGEAWKGTYNAATTYGNANVVQDPTGLSVYRSLKPGNVGHPLTDTAWWFLIIDLSSIKEESDRIKALNDAIAADEAQRVENENGRVTAEQGRVYAETARVTAEQGRVSAEQQRVSAEQQRASQEQTRISQEQSRVTAEQGRVAAEAQRVQKEQLRENNEEQRVINETNRVAAEAERVEQYTADHQQAVADHEQYVDFLGVFDLSKHNAVGGVLATYADMSAALTALNALDSKYKYGGMSFKFVQSSDNKYVQYRLMSDTFNTTPANWQGVDEGPTVGSKNLLESNGVAEVFLTKGFFELTFNIVGGINGSDGSDSSNDNFVRTGYIPVSQGMKLIYDVQEGSSGWCAIACYDSNDDYVSEASVKGTSSGLFTIPNGVAKIRLSSLVAYTNTYAKFQFVSEYTENYPNVITSKITDKAVTYPKLGNDVNSYLNRLLDISFAGGVGYNDGSIGTTAGTNHKMTWYVKVLEGEKINYDLLGLSGGWAVIAAFNSSFEYIKDASVRGKSSSQGASIGQYVVPSGVAYLILCGGAEYDNRASFDIELTSAQSAQVSELIEEFGNEYNGYLQFNITGGFSAETGTDADNSSFLRTDYVAVQKGDIINASVQEGSSWWGALALYDSQKNFIPTGSITGSSSAMDIHVVIPAGVSFIRIASVKTYSFWATKNKVLRENNISEIEAHCLRVNTISTLKYGNILQQKGCIAIQMDLGYLDNAINGCDSMLDVMREYGLMSMDYAINVTALQDNEINKMKERQAEGCEIIYHNRINSPSDFSENSTLTVAELKEGVCAEKLLLTQKGFTTFGVVANIGQLATRYKPTIDDLFFWSEYGSAQILSNGAENTKEQYLTDHRIIRTGFEILHSEYTSELEAEMIAKGKDWIDNLCANKTFGVMYCHYYDRPATDNYHLYEGVLRAMCEYIAEKISDGELWYGRTTECLNYLCR